MKLGPTIAMVAVFVTALLLLLYMPARGETGPDGKPLRIIKPGEAEFYESLRTPWDSSCCGVGDAYYADKQDQCTPLDQAAVGGNHCAFVAIITDDRPNGMLLPDGLYKYRPPVPVGTRIPVTREFLKKLAKQMVLNPINANMTGHTIIFLSQDADEFSESLYYELICYIGQAGS